MAAAGAFAAVSSIFGSPVIGAVLIIEATGLGGPTLPVVLLPGLLLRGSARWCSWGLGRGRGSACSVVAESVSVPDYGGTYSWGDFGWTIMLAVGAAIVVFAVMQLEGIVLRFVRMHTFALTIVSGLLVGGLAVAFEEATGYAENAVLFSGEPAFDSLFRSEATISLSTLALLLLFKGLAWSVSLSSFPVDQRSPQIFSVWSRACWPGTCPATPRHLRSPCSSARPASRPCAYHSAR